MAAINIPQAGVSRVLSNFISSHVPAVTSLVTRLSASTSTIVSASASQTNEDCINEAYETPSGTFASLLAELFPPFLLAVPKSKTSHSRKSMRSANKGLKNKTSELSCCCSLHQITTISHEYRELKPSRRLVLDINLCPACGSPKLMHHLCPKCYSQISRR